MNNIYISTLSLCFVLEIYITLHELKIKHVSALMNEYILIQCSLNQERSTYTYTVMNNYLWRVVSIPRR
jgi:hypothetical protein